MTLRPSTATLAVALLVGLLAATAAPANAQVHARMFRYPDVSETQIAFVYGGDIWVVDKAGGVAHQLSTPSGEESFPRFSPDGSRIAFSGNYDGNVDIYVVASGGGMPARVTYHPGPDRMLDWTPDGSDLLFASSRASGSRRFNQLYTVAVDGGLPSRLPLAYGEFASYSPDGGRLAFTTKAREFRHWKRYRGGLAPDIWLIDLHTLDARNLTASDANDMQPMWHGSALYFLSDRGPDQRSNLWAMDLDGGPPRQLTHFTDFDVTWPAIGPSDIVFQAGDRLWLLDLASEREHEVQVAVTTDLATIRPHMVNVSDLIADADISPSGKRAVFEARGDVFTVPAEHGPIRQLAAGSGSAERTPRWSPDGKQIAYWSDASGEYELVVQPADGSGEPKTLTHLGPGYRYQPFWSSDSKRVAFVDHTSTLRIYDLDADRLTEVDRLPYTLHPGRVRAEVSWSSDGRWLAYARTLPTQQGAVFLFDTSSGERHQVTSGYFSDSAPVFDPDGKYLYYLSNRDLAPVYSDVDSTWIYPNTTNLVAVTLRRDVASPLSERNDVEGAKADEKADAAKAEAPAKKKANAKAKTAKDAKDADEKGAEAKPPEPVKIDLDGFEARAVVMPPEAGNWGELRAVSGKIVYRRTPRSGAGEGPSPIMFWDLEGREEKTILDDADGFGISADGKKMLVVAKGGWAIVDVAPAQKMDKPLATKGLETMLDPRSEWRQMFRDVWRTYRDIFYDPNLHGLDWNALGARYGALIDDAVTRWDVNYAIGELIGEVNSSHTYVSGGDTETPKRRRVGLLGVDWEMADGAYRIARIVRGAPWDIEVRSPLLEPGVDVKEGEYVLAVNGRPLDVASDPYAPFEGLADEAVLLTVNGRPTAEGARRVLVKSLDSETRLRYLEWVEGNRQRVEKASGGRIGYAYVPDTGLRGQTELVRQFNSQMLHAGLIIDERFNGGGQIPDRFVELMNRPKVEHIVFRDGDVISWPQVTHVGPKAMLINGWAGSGGDAFPDIFKKLEVGPLIGERTWGGLIGPATRHALVDGGAYTAPEGRFFDPGRKWFAEGHGVDPDIAVVDDPGAMAKGSDPQLEAAVADVMRRLAENPPTEPQPPAFEKRVP